MRPLPAVAIVGRPNVGKSTLFNRLGRRRSAIVHAQPGVTRDVQRAPGEWTGVSFELIDTGGLFSGVDDDVVSQVEARALREAECADVVLFVVDASAGLMPDDAEVAERVRTFGVPVLLVVNKVEKAANRAGAVEFHRLGFEPVYEVSAMHGEGTGDLLDGVVALLPRDAGEPPGPDLRLAVVGMPNVGKSSLVNALVGDEAAIVDERPGTTRDAVDITLQWRGRRVTLVDTAGIKRKARAHDAMSVLSAIKSLESIERCDVALVLLDASREIANQDVKVGSYPHKAGRGVVVCFNKWDLVEKGDRTYREFEREFRRRFGFLAYAPVLFISALTRQRLGKVIETAWRVKEDRERRIPTAELNRFVVALNRTATPPSHGGGTGRIYYGTQIGVAPPVFSFFVNKTRFFSRSYVRFLSNRLHEAFAFGGTLIRVNLVEKKARGGTR
jgi:GTP-binding protein